MDKAWGQTRSKCVRTLLLREFLREDTTGRVAVHEPGCSQAPEGIV